MSYVRCLRGMASGIEYPAGQPMNLDPVDGRPVEMVLDLDRLADREARDLLEHVQCGPRRIAREVRGRVGAGTAGDGRR